MIAMSQSLTPLGYASGPEQPRRCARTLLALLAMVAVLMSFFSCVVMLLYAHDEPFYGPIRPSQAVLYIGVPLVLIVLWIQWIIVVVILAARKRVHWAWSAATLWALIWLSSLSHCPSGYIQDLVNFQGMSATPTTAPILTQEAVARLEPYVDEIGTRLQRGEALETIAESIARQAQVSPGQVVQFVVALSQRMAAT